MHSIAHKPPLMPYLECVPILMKMLVSRVVFAGQDADFLHTQLGGVPHASVRPMWLRWILGRPKTEFRGDPIWYQYHGEEPIKIGGALAIDGGPLNRLIFPGEVFRFRGWKYVDDPRFKKVERGVFTRETPEGGETTTEDVSPMAKRPWLEIKAMGFAKARKHLRTLGITGKGWDELELEYEGYLLGDD